MTDGPGRILGIGGIFFKANDKAASEAWYRDKLGIAADPNVGAMFHWRSHEEPSKEHLTIWSIFPGDSTYMEPGKASFMINYIVDDMDAFLAKAEAAGVEIDPKREDHDYGRFAWVYDPDGNKIELWQPV